MSADRQGGSVVLRVVDTGIGIPAEALPHIFDMFNQVERSLEKSTGGLGIGLALVKGLVELHGGTVEAFSAGQNEGSEFIVTLPMAPLGRAPIEPVEEVQVTKRPLRILVADDNADSADSLAKLLRLSGHEVHTTYDGMEALEAVQSLRPEVVLLDIGMPKLNGHDVCRSIREQPWSLEVTVIAVSGWGDEQARQRALQAGFDVHLTKPVNHRELMALVARLRTTQE
jgi:CheY-like chemotaxis protein